MGSLAISEELDEMQHNVVFHQGLHCLLSKNQSSEKEIQYYFEIITCDPLIYTMDHPESFLTLLYVASWKIHWSDKG